MINKAFFLIAIIGLVVAAFLYLQEEQQISQTENTPVEVSEELKNNTFTNISEKWEWENETLKKEINSIPAGSPYPFTEASVYAALQEVKVDAQGNIILDHYALLSLDEALERIYDQLSPEGLAALQALIKNALPGITGEQIAELVGNYQQFLLAKDIFSEMYENTDTPYEEQSIDSIENDESLYRELQALRSLHLGSNEASELFRVSDAAAQYMFDSMKLSMNDSLSDEDLAQRQDALQARQIQQALNITDWQSRYDALNSQKQSLLASSLSAQEKESQFQMLLKEQFSDEEIEKMAYFGLTEINI